MYNKKARSFVTIMITVAVVMLLLRLAIHKIIVYNMEQSQSLAQVNLKLLSTALENYAKDNKGVYPVNIGQLTKSNPIYLENDYLNVSAVRGYQYDCQRMDVTGYNCSASPLNCKFNGKIVYSVSTGGLIISESCDNK